jgi:hypothetical protein
LPDLVQSDPALAFPLNGGSYCGPVAASNALVGLARAGYPGLVPAASSEREGHLALAREIASPRFMGTSAVSGTGPSGVLVGLERWVARAGYRIRRLEYQGWRAHPVKYATHVRFPDPAWIASALRAGGAALIHVGWYLPVRWDGGYHRRGGHWLAVVEVSADNRELVLVDPAPYGGEQQQEERATVSLLDSGYLKEGDVTLSARGFFALGGGMKLKRAEDTAILDGAIALVLEPLEPRE